MNQSKALAKDMARQISKLISETEQYKEYQRARTAIYADKDLHKKLNDFLGKHLRFLLGVKDGTAAFEEERYLSQEFHKLMLNKDINIYFEMGLYYVETLAEIYSTSLSELDIDLDFVEV